MVRCKKNESMIIRCRKIDGQDTDVRRDITEMWLRIDLGSVYSVKLWYRGASMY